MDDKSVIGGLLSFARSQISRVEPADVEPLHALIELSEFGAGSDKQVTRETAKIIAWCAARIADLSSAGLRDPLQSPPPAGETIILGTDTGTLTLGKWDPEGGFVGWAPKPAFTPEMRARFKGRSAA